MKNLDNRKISSSLLRIGLAVVFIYAGVSSYMHPEEWVGYLPPFLEKMKNAVTLLQTFAVVEMALAVWLLIGKYARFAALLSAALLIGIIVAQPNDLIITFRDIGLVFMALGLAFME